MVISYHTNSVYTSFSILVITLYSITKFLRQYRKHPPKLDFETYLADPDTLYKKVRFPSAIEY